MDGMAVGHCAEDNTADPGAVELSEHNIVDGGDDDKQGESQDVARCGEAGKTGARFRADTIGELDDEVRSQSVIDKGTSDVSVESKTSLASSGQSVTFVASASCAFGKNKFLLGWIRMKRLCFIV